MTRRTSLLTALALTTLVACFGGGDDDVDGPGTGPLTDDDIRAVCQISCEKQVRCGITTDQATCENDCFADSQTSSVDWMRADGVLAVVECQADLACDAEGPTVEACFGACTATTSHTRFETECRQTMAACWDPQQLNSNCSTSHIEGVSDSGLMCLVLPSIMDEMTACMTDSPSCDAALTCVQGVFERHMIDL